MRSKNRLLDAPLKKRITHALLHAAWPANRMGYACWQIAYQNLLTTALTAAGRQSSA
jgi:hypothetical protein